MSRFTQYGQGSPVPFGSTSTDQSLGTLTGAKFVAEDGREFLLVQNGGTALASGNLVQGPAAIGNHQNRTLGTSAIGATTITIALGATSATPNMYAGGYLTVNAGTGIGQTLLIASHPGVAASGTVTLTLEDPLQVATLVSDSKGTLSLPFAGSANGGTWVSSSSNVPSVSMAGVVVCPTTLTGQVIGVTILPIGASSTTVPTYGFIQTRGIVGCLNDANTNIGVDLMPSTNTAGAVMTYVVATSSRVGSSTVAGVTTEVRPINIQL